MSSESLSLFPLHTVLVPGAALGLRIFEPRYLDLIRDCSRQERGFGICLILESDEEGTAAAAAYGTEALIEDFGSGDDGLLTLQVRGHRRFLIRRVRVRDNGLQVAEVAWCDDGPAQLIRPEHALLATLLQQILEQVGGEYANVPARRFDDAVWVGWRLAELLPMTDEQRQALLQHDDPHERLQQVLSLLP
ncbi:LON peptidase substrate-binding domain-containing protein [Lysobacter sp. D1-1-M9]|uniref:LON peptidase substrate-binding domain-containing protein n=1 Tax=Novilysobacter longmucuonensis TaxID=3098603 RepID=UPI002FCA702E